MVRTMSAEPSPNKANVAQGHRDASAVSPQMVSMTKAQHTELVMQVAYWKSQHVRAVQRQQWRHDRFGRIVHQLKEQAGKREAELLAQLALAQAQIRDLCQRVFERKKKAQQRGERTTARPV